MNTRNDEFSGRGAEGLGWLVRCKTGCEGIVHESVPRVGDPCPCCPSENEDKSQVIYCVKIAAAGDSYEQLTIEGGISLEGDVVQAWDIDLGSFLTSVDSEDRNVTQTDRTDELYGIPALATENRDGEKTIGSDEQGIQERHAGESQKNDLSAKPTAARFSEPEQPDSGSEESMELLTPADRMRFSKWHVLGLICCATLLLIGGLLTFDVVRAIYSPNDMSTASPILKVLR